VQFEAYSEFKVFPEEGEVELRGVRRIWVWFWFEIWGFSGNSIVEERGYI